MYVGKEGGVSLFFLSLLQSLHSPSPQRLGDLLLAYLEEAVHLRGLVPLPLRLLDVQLRFLRYIQRNVLLRRGPRRGRGPVEARLSFKDIDGEGAVAMDEAERAVFPAERAEAEARHGEAVMEAVYERLFVV